MAMPAMSPTMTEGGLAEWKLQEGQAYAQGDVLLDIETDKATMDVEAPEDGVLAKILVPNGTKDVPVGKTIALLAEEGDDLSNIEIPRDEEPSAAPDASAPATPPASEAPKHVESAASSAAPPATEAHAAVDGTLMPSVARLLTENNIDDPSKIKGTGLHGRLTKGDVLAFLGQASSPTGTYTPPHGGVATLYGGGATPSPAKGTTASASDRQTLTPPQSDKAQTPAGITGVALRTLIIGGLVDVAHRKAVARAAPSNASGDPTAPPADQAATPAPTPSKPSFDDVLAGYRL